MRRGSSGRWVSSENGVTGLATPRPSGRRREWGPPGSVPAAQLALVPSAGFEPAHPAPEADALSPELRGRCAAPRRPVHRAASVGASGCGADCRSGRLHASRTSAILTSNDRPNYVLADGDRRRPRGARYRARAGRGPASCARPAPSTATGRPTSRSSLRRRPAERPRELADDLAAALQRPRSPHVESLSRSPGPGSSTSGFATRGCTTRSPRSSRPARRATPLPISATASGSRSSSSPRTRPGPLHVGNGWLGSLRRRARPGHRAAAAGTCSGSTT